MGAQKSSLGAPKKVEMEKLEGKITVPAPFGDSNRLPYESCNLECLSFTLHARSLVVNRGGEDCTVYVHRYTESRMKISTVSYF